MKPTGRVWVALLALLASPTHALDLSTTSLAGAWAGSSRSSLAASLGVGGYELSDGTQVSFRGWYQPRIQTMNLLFRTEVADGTDVIWGVATAESGKKYRITPGVWLGLQHQARLGRNATLSASLLTLLGGGLRERPCEADYGEFGGGYRVNCRLAASALPPEQTLDYLARASGWGETVVTLRYELRFSLR